MTGVAEVRGERRGHLRLIQRRGAWFQGLATTAAVTLAAAGLMVVLGLTRLVDPGQAFLTGLMLAMVALLLFVAIVVGRTVGRQRSERSDLLMQVLEAVPHGQLILGPDGNAVHSNTAFETLFPGRAHPLAAISEALDGDEQAHDQFNRLQSLVASGSRARAELRYRDHGRAQGWLLISVYPMVGRKGFSLWSIEDVTARHQMEQVIREDQAKLIDFLDNAPSGFYSIDGTGRFTLVNQTLAGWLGASAEELVNRGARLQDFIMGHAEDGSTVFDPFVQSSGNDVMLQGRQGRITHAFISQSVVMQDGQLRTRSVVRDLTPEREWQEQLRISRRRFQHFFEVAPVGIALIDANVRFAETNRALSELLGQTGETLTGKRLMDFIAEEDRREVSRQLGSLRQDESAASPIEVHLSAAKERVVALFPSRLGEVDGSMAGVMLHFIDLTQLKNLEVQFAQSQKMQAVGQLAGGVAHDFNNLLTAMIGFCDLLLLRFRPGDPSFADIMQVKQNANRAANLVRQLLAFSRQQTLQPRILNITDVIAELSHLLNRLIGDNIELKVIHGRDLGLVKVDQGQLEQVIINLAVNARDAMTNGGALTIRTSNVTTTEPAQAALESIPPGNYVQIEVTDDGVGIPKENLVRIFEPFFSTKEIGSGTGLGLSTVYGIVKQTGGFIAVNSTLGLGTAFSIYLPRYEQDIEALPLPRTESAEIAAEAVSSKDLTGAGTILLVEDEDPVRMFSARALRNKGYQVIEAKSAEAALEIINEANETIDLIITDVVMPRLDGPGLIKLVRETNADIRVIFISGYAEDAFRKRLDVDSNIHFLPKPFSLKVLAGKVKDVLSAA